ncbi:MAG: hypothetical protein IKI57_00600 [Clostridia bacterium]|nr:hypothetical protein [Clostridia bacterium]
MIKKLLLLILVIVLAIGLWNSYSKGVSINLGSLKVETCSYTSLIDKAKELSRKTNELNTANNSTYPAELRNLDIAKSNFKVNKNDYDDLAARASVEEIRAVNQTKEYLLDYLWMKIGTYANDNDVKVLIDHKEKEAKINFDVSGQYIAVINFIYDLERDADLSFNVDNIVMQGGSSDSITKASFTVSNVNIITSENNVD